MGQLRHIGVPLLLTGLLAGACAANSGTEPSAAATPGPDTAVSDATAASARPGAIAGRGTAVIAVKDKLSGQPLSLMAVQVRTVGWPMPAELAIDIARMTDSRGEYVWPQLPPGVYEFTVLAPATQAKTSKQAIIAADQTTRIELELTQ
ncbi:hypothetical protein Rhe02_20910 [Rhizocola hellebori]|uniref:Carboxypeptidase regulatory-like domain-containing protein n=1 Tax=Rhizocola hellebori TaxID=1392758 RepID=A0A8J3Q5Y9_9ACTN|nr:carboxypeptidase-like regulatory domain-containing protein [Rhizocola hellebori]GIH04024.1 hypothetical protein Rhe02_20910 [Rhizocola hellebori]